MVPHRCGLVADAARPGPSRRRPTGGARADLGRACDALEIAVRINPGDHWSRNLLGIAYSSIGGVLTRLGQDREALAAYRRAIDHQRRSFESNTANKDYREDLSHHYLGLAALLRKVGSPGEAAAATLERQRLWPDNPDDLYHSALDLAECVPLVGRGRAELTREERTECRRYADQALDVLRRAIAAGLPGPRPLRPPTSTRRGRGPCSRRGDGRGLPRQPLRAVSRAPRSSHGPSGLLLGQPQALRHPIPSTRSRGWNAASARRLRDAAELAGDLDVGVPLHLPQRPDAMSRCRAGRGADGTRRPSERPAPASGRPR